MYKVISNLQRSSTAELGENIVRHYLLMNGIIVHRVGQEGFPADLIVPFPDGKIFKGKAVIQVKAESKHKNPMQPSFWMYPTKSGIQKLQNQLKQIGYSNYELWLALVWLRWEHRGLNFKSCIFPVGELQDDDYYKMKTAEGLSFVKLWNKRNMLKLEPIC